MNEITERFIGGEINLTPERELEIVELARDWGDVVEICHHEVALPRHYNLYYFCSRYLGHSGPHVALSSKSVYAIWDNDQAQSEPIRIERLSADAENADIGKACEWQILPSKWNGKPYLSTACGMNDKVFAAGHPRFYCPSCGKRITHPTAAPQSD